jgi:hypothetical protein
MDLFLSRCADTYADDRGVILPLTDGDLIESLKAMKERNESLLESLLMERFRSIALK